MELISCVGRTSFEDSGLRPATTLTLACSSQEYNQPNTSIVKLASEQQNCTWTYFWQGFKPKEEQEEVSGEPGKHETLRRPPMLISDALALLAFLLTLPWVSWNCLKLASCTPLVFWLAQPMADAYEFVRGYEGTLQHGSPLQKQC